MQHTRLRWASGPSIINLWGPDNDWGPPSIAMFGDESKHMGQMMPKGGQFLCSAHPMMGSTNLRYRSHLVDIRDGGTGAYMSGRCTLLRAGPSFPIAWESSDTCVTTLRQSSTMKFPFLSRAIITLMVVPSPLSSMVMLLDNIVPQSKEMMRPISNMTKSTTREPWLILQAGERCKHATLRPCTDRQNWQSHQKL